MRRANKTVNEDADEQAEGVSYVVGREFEEQFAKFMQKKLDWTNVRVGAHMCGKYNAKGTTIDILGQRLDSLGIKYNSVANKWIGASAGLIVLSGLWWWKHWGEHGAWFLVLSLISLACGAMFKILSGINNQQNAWVECKNLKGRANVNHISKMLREYQDYKATKNEDHRFTHLYFASANGYVENALKMAMDNSVICYEKKGNSFSQVNYFK